MHDTRPMSGLLVLDLTQGIAGPYAARLMAEHGARVIKIEPPAGDWVRSIGTGPAGVSVNYLYYNFGKENVKLDIRDPGERDAVLQMAASADVFIESARPGVAARRGLGFEDIRAVNPNIQYLSVSGYGQSGPRGADPMTDTVAQAFSGMMSVNLGMDGVPHKIQTTIIDAITGLYAFQTLSMALMSGRDEARHLDVSLMQAAAAVMGPKVMEFAHLGQNPLSPNPPAGSFRTADGWIAVTVVKEENWVAWATAMERRDLLDDPRFTSFAQRGRHLAELLEILAPVFLTRTTTDWMARLSEANVLCSTINDFGDWLADEHVQATEGAPRMEVVSGAEAPVPRTPGRMPYRVGCAGHGEDTDRVLAEFGLTR